MRKILKICEQILANFSKFGQIFCKIFNLEQTKNAISGKLFFVSLIISYEHQVVFHYILV